MAHLIIEDEEAFEMARKLADQHRTSVDDIVAEALREKFAREEPLLPRKDPAAPELTREELVEKWMKLTEGLGKRVKEPWKSTPHGDLLYDDLGLPK